MGSLSLSPSSHATASRWTRSGRRCSRSSPRRTGSTRPSPASRRPPGRLSAGLIRLTVTSVTTARKCSSSRSASMRPTTSPPRPTSPSRRPRSSSRRSRATSPPSPGGSCSWRRRTRKLKGIEEELETSAEKALEREEKLVEKIYNLQSKYKTTEARFEYGEMNITKLNQRIDDIEDEIYREKLKIKKCSDELDDTFDDMIANY